MSGLQIQMLPDGRRLHLHNGPMDLIVEAFGVDEATRSEAYRRAAVRFAPMLDELVTELSCLRAPYHSDTLFKGGVAKRMHAACEPFSAQFVTPMAAVAGAAADETLSQVIGDQELSFRKVYVNNGGDVAFYLGEGARTIAQVASASHAKIEINSQHPWRGIATSGWRGRSFSFGVADAVTVVAKDAAVADVAATMIANAVDLPGHPAIRKVPACDLLPDSDLREKLVTSDVGHLSRAEQNQALDAGVKCAQTYLQDELIGGALLSLGTNVRQVLPPEMLALPQA